MSLGSQISRFRKQNGMTQLQLAEAVEVSFQAVSSWERDEYQPDVEHLLRLARALRTGAGVLLEEVEKPAWQLEERLFDEQHMYTFVRAAALARELPQTLRALPLMRRYHEGQTRKGRQEVPYRIHPLTLACHALALGVAEDDVLAAALLHDVVEDCGASLEELPVGDAVRHTVELLSYPPQADKDAIKPAYYAAIRTDPAASLIKCLDRCNNLATMVCAFPHRKMVRYVQETERYLFPLLAYLKNECPAWNSAAWLLTYQIKSLLLVYKGLL